MAAHKDAHALTKYYKDKFKERYGRSPIVNDFAARWGFDSVLNGMNSAQAKELLDYYFTTPPERQHDLQWFFYNYEKLIIAMHDARTDAERRKVLMAQSKVRAEQWRKSGKFRTLSD